MKKNSLIGLLVLALAALFTGCASPTTGTEAVKAIAGLRETRETPASLTQKINGIVAVASNPGRVVVVNNSPNQNDPSFSGNAGPGGYISSGGGGYIISYPPPRR